MGKRTLGRRLRELRQTRRLTQRKLANLADLDPQTVSRIERGENTNPESETVTSLAAALGVSPDDLLGPPVMRAG